MNKACTRSSDTVCEPLERFFCIERNKDGCRRAVQHSECRPGQYIKQAGKLSNYINMHGQCMKCCLLLSVLHYLQLRKRAFFICNILCICNYIAFLFYNYSMFIVCTGTGSTDTVCADCKADTYSDGSFSSCKPHTK